MHQPLRAIRALPPLLILASASLAQAADAPVIERVLDDSGKETRVVTPARTFEVQGRSLYTPPADPKAPDPKAPGPKVKGFPGLSATLGGKALVPLAASPTSLRFRVPADLPERKGQTLVIRVGSQSVKTRVDVGPSDQGGDPTTDNEPVSAFQITTFTHTSTGASATFRAAGLATGVPDGMKLTLTLKFGKHDLRTRALKIKNERFSVSFGPFRERLPVGIYGVELSFSLNAQRRSQVKIFAETLKAAAKRGEPGLAAYRSVRRQSLVSVGGTGPGGQILAKDRAPQSARLRERIEGSLKTTEALLKELEAALALAQRVYFRESGASGLNEARYPHWLVDKGHAEDEATAKRLLADTRFASRRGELDEQAYATWIQERICAGVRGELAAAARFAGETLCPIDPAADALARRALGELLGIARSEDLFRVAKLRLPPGLRDFGLEVRPASGAKPKALRATLALLRQRLPK